MPVAHLVAAAVSFVWLGMVLGISFLEAPLKFRAPGITTVLGLGIGQIVFRALHRVEVNLLAALVVSVALGPVEVGLLVAAGWLVVLLGVQLLVVGRRLHRRSDRVLAGQVVPRSSEHHVFVVLEVLKVVLLVTTGVVALV